MVQAFEVDDDTPTLVVSKSALPEYNINHNGLWIIGLNIKA